MQRSAAFQQPCLLPRIRTTAVALFYIYLLFTIILYRYVGNFGHEHLRCRQSRLLCDCYRRGFSTYNDSIAHFHSAGIEIVTGLLMILAAGNFAL